VRVNDTEDVAIKKLALVVPESGSFEVQYDRLRQTGTSAILFGAVGYAIAESYNDSMDAKKEGEIIHSFKDLDCSRSVRTNMAKVFGNESDIQVDVFLKHEDVAGKYDAVAQLDLIECGFTLGNQDIEKLFPYVTLNAKVVSSEGKIIWDDREKIVGSEGRAFGGLVGDKGTAKQLMDDLLSEAGARLAYNIIYQ